MTMINKAASCIKKQLRNPRRRYLILFDRSDETQKIFAEI
jgi:hypothetical protein